MSPASVKGVAEIVYTPFADVSSSWRMVLTSLGSRFLPRMSLEQIYTLHVPQGNQSSVACVGIKHASRHIAHAFVLSGLIRLL
jgi:hypothetical protein